MKIQQILEAKKGVRAVKNTVKPRNFVAKNAIATTSGAGAHKDKKKAAKQGDVKHKNQELAEAVAGPEKCWPGHRKVGTKPGTGKNAGKRVNDCEKIGEGSDPEYDDEAGMADNNLETLKRSVAGIDELIQPEDNLPEWCQEKIAVANSMLVTVWDYMLSEKERADGVEEGMYRRPGSPSAYDRDHRSSVSGMGKRDSLAYQLDGGANDEGWGEEPYQAPQDKPLLQGYYFYNVPAGKEQEAASYGIKQTKTGKWAKAKYNTSGRSFEMQKDMADKAFGPGKYWAPK